MSTMKPCPFCGSEPNDYAIEAHSHTFKIDGWKMPDHGGSHVIECVCGAGLIAGTRAEVLAMWNRRAPRAPPDWWHCDTHGPGTHAAWGCPECVREMRDEIKALKAAPLHPSSVQAVDGDEPTDDYAAIIPPTAERWWGPNPGMANADRVEGWDACRAWVLKRLEKLASSRAAMKDKGHEKAD